MRTTCCQSRSTSIRGTDMRFAQWMMGILKNESFDVIRDKKSSFTNSLTKCEETGVFIFLPPCVPNLPHLAKFCFFSFGPLGKDKAKWHEQVEYHALFPRAPGTAISKSDCPHMQKNPPYRTPELGTPRCIGFHHQDRWAFSQLHTRRDRDSRDNSRTSSVQQWWLPFFHPPMDIQHLKQCSKIAHQLHGILQPRRLCHVAERIYRPWKSADAASRWDRSWQAAGRGCCRPIWWHSWPVSNVEVPVLPNQEGWQLFSIPWTLSSDNH